MRVITCLILGLVFMFTSCSKEDPPFDPNEILYGEWNYNYNFSSIYEDNLELNYEDDLDELVTFVTTSKAEIYNDRIPEHLSIDSFYYRINETRDTLFTKRFFQSGEYFEGYNPNTPFRAQVIDSFSNDFFRISTIWTRYIEEVDRTLINTLIEKYSRL